MSSGVPIFEINKADQSEPAAKAGWLKKTAARVRGDGKIYVASFAGTDPDGVQLTGELTFRSHEPVGLFHVHRARELFAGEILKRGGKIVAPILLGLVELPGGENW